MVAPGIDHIRTGLSDCNHLPFQHWVLHTRPGTSRVHRHHRSCWLQSGTRHDSQSHGTESCKAPSPAVKTLLASDLLPCPYQVQIALRLRIQPSVLLKKAREPGSLSTSSAHFCLGTGWQGSLPQSTHWYRPKDARKPREQTKPCWTQRWTLLRSPSSR